jgi:hypothetical protein
MNDANILHTNLKNWLTIEKRIKEHQDKIKEHQIIIKQLKEQQNKYSSPVKNSMTSNSIDEINVTNGKVRYVRKQVRQSISKKYLLDIFTKYFGNDIEAQQLIQVIYDSRELTEKEVIQYKEKKEKKERTEND